ncbi:MAG: sacsin N-terminal ATP-binding-like domain-containing protein [Dehalococcoidia bacterium]
MEDAVSVDEALQNAADRFLEALIAGVDPPFEPDESDGWAAAFLASVRRFREARNFMHSKEAERAAETLGKQAAADIYRFFWEFWQNADDAEATEIEFTIDGDRLVITNNGRAFNTQEVYSLIFVASTTKGSRPDLMGQFGVGSLALMRFSEAPTYHSGNYAFTLKRSFTYPALAEQPLAGYFPGTRVIAPLKRGVDPHRLFSDLAEKIESETLLYMKNLKRVIVRDLIGGEETEATIGVRPHGEGDIVTVGSHEWLRFAREVVPPRGMRRDDGTEVSGAVTITLVRQEQEGGPHPVCAYFPTQKYHRYPWRFSAPFDVTTGRENLIRSDFNRWLLCETGRKMVQAAMAKGVGSPSQPWDLVPLDGHSDDLLNEVWRVALEEMQSVAWLPTRGGRVRPVEAAFPETREIRQLVRNADLTSLGETRRWIAGIPSQRARPVLQSLGTLRVCCHVLSNVLARGPRNRKPDWHLRALASIIELSQELGDEEVEARLLEGKCVLNRNGQPTSLAAARLAGRVVCNARSEVLARELGGLFQNRLVTVLHRVYRLPDRKTTDPKDELRREVDEWLRLVSSDETFQYETRLDAPAFIKRFIAGSSPPSNPEEYSDRLLYFVRDHLEAYVSDQGPHRRQQTLLELGRSLLVKAHTTEENDKDKTEYRPISEVHIPAGFLDRSPWSRAAKGVPGLWWIDWRYRKSLVRRESPVGVVAFLKALGAATGPRIKPVATNASHNVHRFTRVTRGDPARYPNFPHASTPFGRYSDHGLVGDSQSPDFVAWIQHVQGLSSRERSQRGEALLRTLEDQWESYKGNTKARATGYYSNAEHELGRVPARWLWELQQCHWVATSDGKFARPEDTYARTDESLALLDPQKNSVCQWIAHSSDVAEALGFKTEIPGAMVVGYFRDAQTHGQDLPTHRAAAYYEHLGRTEVAFETVEAAFKEGLIYARGRRRSWWHPDECLRRDQRDIFGDYCGYLDAYASADRLWERLGVAESPDLGFLVRFWARVSKTETSQSRELRRVLEATYLLAERLLAKSKPVDTAVPVLADGEWRDTSRVFVTKYDELANQLRAISFYRWDYEFPELAPRFQRWTGILQVERNAEIRVICTGARPDLDVEERLHAGVQSFGVEVSRIRSDLWPIVRARVRDILQGRVQRLEPLRVQVRLSHPKVGDLMCQVVVPALYQDGNVFVSGLTALADPSLANALFSGLPLGGEARWSAINSLRLHLMSDHPSDSEPLDVVLDEEDQAYEQFGKTEQQLADEGEEEIERPSVTPQKKILPKPPAPPAHPVDAFEVESDEGGEEPTELEGGLVGRRMVHLRRPIKGPGGGGGGGPGPDSHPRKSTEERAVDLFRLYVLEPAGVEIVDQRLRAGVGADLVGDDNVFRELKARSGSAADKIELSSHEYVRAGQAGTAYELVIVEYVWGDPVITTIRNPLGRLKHFPVGGITVEGWKELDPQPRVIRLRKSETAN